MASAETNIVRLLESFQVDRLREKWEAMRALLHPESRLESLAAPGKVLSADELVDAIQAAMAYGVYAVKAWDVEYLSQRAAIAAGRVRYRVGEAGFTDEARIWLASEHEGLIWRMRIFRERKEAIGCLRTYGPDLGL